MAVTLLNSSAYIYGVVANETGTSTASFRVRVEPEFRVPRVGLQGAIEGWAIGPNQMTVSIEGEVNAPSGTLSGVMTATTIVAFTATNSIASYWGGAQSGVLFLTDGEVTNERGSWKSFTANFQSNSGVTAA